MRILQLTAGTGSFYCGTCLRDNGLVRGLRQLEQDAMLVPMYLPMVTDEQNEAEGAEVFFGGVNVYLQQISPVFAKLPGPLHRALDSSAVLRLAATQAGSTQPSELGPLTLSMLEGEDGRQARELDRLCSWLEEQPRPLVVLISNALLIGLAREIRRRAQVPVLCTLQGEDAFLDALGEPHSARAWDVLRERAQDIDAFIPVSQWYADEMIRRADLDPERVHPVHNGIELTGYPEAVPDAPAEPAVGYFARLCPEKGFDRVVDAYLQLRAEPGFETLRFIAGGARTSGDRAYVKAQAKRLEAAGADFEIHANVSREEKIALLGRMSVLAAAPRAPEAFGLYIIEAMAAGVPVAVAPSGAFPELIERSGGGLLSEGEEGEALALPLRRLLSDDARRRTLAAKGHDGVRRYFTQLAMARGVLEIIGRSEEALAA